MSSLSSLQVALKVAEMHRDQAGVALGTAVQQETFARDQLQQLQSYAHETESRWLRTGQSGLTPGLMQHHYQFMGRLDHATGLQHAVVEEARRRVERQRRVVMDAEMRVSTLQKLLQRKRADAQAAEARRDQREMDEFAANLIRRRVSDLQGVS
ncbi:MAG: flagellar export protein FliJ [Rhodoferax sp.]|nr:flagellar export protein FliJ [Rhodoferax sp.]